MVFSLLLPRLVTAALEFGLLTVKPSFTSQCNIQVTVALVCCLFFCVTEFSNVAQKLMSKYMSFLSKYMSFYHE